jgi:hypothetical protein
MVKDAQNRLMKAAVIGPEEYVWEGAWAIEAIEERLRSQNVTVMSIPRPFDIFEQSALRDNMLLGQVSALVLANFEPDSGEVFPLDKTMCDAAQIAAESDVPIYSIAPLLASDLQVKQVKPDLIICKPHKLHFIKKRLTLGG